MISIRSQEWHMTPENKKTLEDLIQNAVHPEVAFVSHHIVWRNKDGSEIELSSPEAFLFNKEILESLFGHAWDVWAKTLAITPEVERLHLLERSRNFWQKDYGGISNFH